MTTERSQAGILTTDALTDSSDMLRGQLYLIFCWMGAVCAAELEKLSYRAPRILLLSE